MKYLVIGLGNLGRAIAKDLTRVGNEVIGVDMDLHRVDMLKNDIAGAVALDSTDKEALSTLPLLSLIHISEPTRHAVRISGLPFRPSLY